MGQKLNIGCGFNKLPGYINVDREPTSEPDVVADLESAWPFADNSVEEIIANHVLEHLGQDTRVFLGIMKEMYRVCQPDARIQIRCPHHEHWTFHADPTHVRKILPEGLLLFDRELNDKYIREGAANTPLGIYCGVDFVLEKSEPAFDEPWATRIRNDLATNYDLGFASRHYNNVIAEWYIVLRVRKG